MRLKEVRITNYRSINDSGPIEVGHRTALVGRNESGKTNLLLALRSLNPPGELQELSYVKDFPRHRHKKEFSEDTQVVETLWGLSDEETAVLERLFPRGKGVTEVTVGRPYKPVRWVRFHDLKPLEVDYETVGDHMTKISRSVSGSLKKIEDADISQGVSKALETLIQTLSNRDFGAAEWAEQATKAIKTFRESSTALKFTLPNTAATHIEAVEKDATDITSDEASHEDAVNWIDEILPEFIYFEEYPQLEGHQNIPEYIQRKQNKQLKEADEHFEKLCRVAGLDPMELNQLLQKDHETRQLLANRAGAVVTQKVHELWTDRKLTVRFNLDANHFDTLVYDPSAIYPVEINLNERSRGFKWFFSFYTTFAADTKGGPAENAILLLDEPGLHLHAIAQRNLLDHFAKDFKNCIIYTTHSPFMIPVDDLPCIRTLNISPEEGTTVTNTPSGDERTLFPIQAALGYDLTQTLFVGEKSLVVEGVSDYWYLSCLSDYMNDENARGLPRDLVITPAGGAPKVPYMVALLTSQRLKVLVLLDAEKQARVVAKQLVKSKLIRDQNVVFISEGFDSTSRNEADIEDLLDPTVYEKLVSESYSQELEGKNLNLNNNIPRIVKRYEEAFKTLGIEFNKMRPARLFLRRIGEDPQSLITPTSRAHFENLFKIVLDRLAKQMVANRPPFT